MVKSKKGFSTEGTVRTKDRIKKTGEVFTPPELVSELLDKFPSEIWADPTETTLDPCCGNGNFLVEVKRRYMDAGQDERYILDKLIYGVDIMPDNVRECRIRLGLTPEGNDGNIVCADALKYDFEFVKTEKGYLLNYDPAVTAEDEKSRKKDASKSGKKSENRDQPADDYSDFFEY